MQLTCNTHGHPNICCGQGRCIIDAVTNMQDWTMPLAVLCHLCSMPQVIFATAAVNIAVCLQNVVDKGFARVSTVSTRICLLDYNTSKEDYRCRLLCSLAYASVHTNRTGKLFVYTLT